MASRRVYEHRKVQAVGWSILTLRRRLPHFDMDIVQEQIMNELVAQDFQYVVVLMDRIENNVANSRKVEQPSRNYFQFLFELCCRVRRLSCETEDWLWNRKWCNGSSAMYISTRCRSTQVWVISGEPKDWGLVGILQKKQLF